jgi:hypothetical protein
MATSVTELLFSVQDSLVTLQAVESILLDGQKFLDSDSSGIVWRDRIQFREEHIDRIARYFQTNGIEILLGADRIAVTFKLPTKAPAQGENTTGVD